MQTIYSDILNAINAAENIIITAHKSPDGDSIGSSLALHRFLKNLGKKSFIVHPDPVSPYLVPFLGKDKVHDYKNNPEAAREIFNAGDLIFILDYNDPGRVGEEMQKDLEKSTQKKIMIDHHLNPTDFVDLVLSQTSSCSTAQLIFDVIEYSGSLNLLDEQIAEALYLGILTDSGSFRFPSVQSRTHEVIAQLLNTGLHHARIHEEIYDNNTLDRLKLRSYIINNNLELFEKHKTAISFVTEEEKARFNYKEGDTEGMVNIGLSIEGINKSVFFNESEGKIKISFRSKGVENPINWIASEHFSGGGHANAAGGVSFDNLEETIKKFVAVLEGIELKV